MEQDCRGTTSRNWNSEIRPQVVRKKAWMQSLWKLRLAVDWHHNVETMPTGPQANLMRTMLIENLAVDQRIANGTAGNFCKMSPYGCSNKCVSVCFYIMRRSTPPVAPRGDRKQCSNSASCPPMRPMWRVKVMQRRGDGRRGEWQRHAT